MIDYSVQKGSRNYLYNFRVGARHIAKAFKRESLPLLQRIFHIALGVFELIPVIGHVVSASDDRVHKYRRVLSLKETDLYLRGEVNTKNHKRLQV